MSPVYRYYLNALFDLELGNYPVDTVKRSAAEMSVLFLPLLCQHDRIVLDVGIPDGYLEYLKRNGCIESITLDDPFADQSGCIDVVWGWNENAAARLKVSDIGQSPTAIIAKVNHRGFCHDCAKKYGFGVPESHICATVKEIDDVVTRLAGHYPLVVKPAFGGSGFGFHVLDDGAMFTKKRSNIENYCQHGGCAIEPWCQRIADISSCTMLDGIDTPYSLLLHRQWVNRYGAFYGIYIQDEDPIIDRWRENIERMSSLYIRDLAATGYTGPVGMDSFIYNDRNNGVERLAAGIEINGRYTMGLLAHQIRNKLEVKKNLLLRVISKKRCKLPATYERLLDFLGENRFDPEKKEGIIVLTPLITYYEGTWEQPQRSVFLIAGKSEVQIESLDNALRHAVAVKGQYLMQ
jgi:hypothetical protein